MKKLHIVIEKKHLVYQLGSKIGQLLLFLLIVYLQSLHGRHVKVR